jgi:para-aminobenzoate synthetase/4-amino-4-deoxychorismate lyase
LIETMLWNGAFPLLELHLDRLADSADYFGFAWDRDEVKASLLRVAEGFGDGSPWRVRMTLAPDGDVHIEHGALLAGSDQSPQLRACIATQRIDARDRFLFHKTTNRELYVQAYRAARDRGFADAIFLNRE